MHVIYFIKISFFSLYIYRYESKRQEIEAWLMRMESRAERMGTAAAQADVLDFSALEASQKEQKVCGNDDFRHLLLYFFLTKIGILFLLILMTPIMAPHYLYKYTTKIETKQNSLIINLIMKIHIN